MASARYDDATGHVACALMYVCRERGVDPLPLKRVAEGGAIQVVGEEPVSVVVTRTVS